MRQAGFDHLVLKGRAKHETCLLIRDGRIEFKEAHSLKDKSFSDQRSILRKDVLAAKNVLAMVCSGTVALEVKDPEGIIAYEKKFLESIDEPPAPNTPDQNGQDSEIMEGPAGSVDLTHIKQTLMQIIGVQCLGLPSGKKRGTGGNELNFQITADRILLNTGLALNEDELKQIAYRCIAMERIYNIREGIASNQGRQADDYRENGWTRKAVVQKTKVFDPLRIDDLWNRFK
jgi:aldehyde:ferredoxin oxidoreductase